MDPQAARHEKDRLYLLKNKEKCPRALKADAKRAVEKQAVVDHVRNKCGIKKPGRPKSK